MISSYSKSSDAVESTLPAARREWLCIRLGSYVALTLQQQGSWHRQRRRPLLHWARKCASMASQVDELAASGLVNPQGLKEVAARLRANAEEASERAECLPRSERGQPAVRDELRSLMGDLVWVWEEAGGVSVPSRWPEDREEGFFVFARAAVDFAQRRIVAGMEGAPIHNGADADAAGIEERQILSVTDSALIDAIRRRAS